LPEVTIPRPEVLGLAARVCGTNAFSITLRLTCSRRCAWAGQTDMARPTSGEGWSSTTITPRYLRGLDP